MKKGANCPFLYGVLVGGFESSIVRSAGSTSGEAEKNAGFAGNATSQFQRFCRRLHPGGVALPVECRVVHEQLDFAAVGILQVKTLAHRVIGLAIDGVSLLKDARPGLIQVFQAFTDFPANVIQADAFPRQRTLCLSHLDQQQLVVGAATGQQGGAAVEYLSGRHETDGITVKPE
jgi:hypothetical protein